MKNLIFLLEEPSAKEMLKIIVPKLCPDIETKYIVFEGKQDLEKRMVRRLKGWKKPNSCFLIMRDQDAGNCVKIKNGLVEKIRESGQNNSLVRIACRELESFYLGDLQALSTGLKIPKIVKQSANAKFRDPDHLHNPATELEKLTGHRYQKIQGARDISPFLRLDGSNKSKSFNVLLDGIKHLTSG